MSRTNTLRKIDESVDPNEKKQLLGFTTIVLVEYGIYIYMCVCVFYSTNMFYIRTTML